MKIRFKQTILHLLTLTLICISSNLVASTLVVVDIAGQFSSDPSAVGVTGSPGPFPVPELLGGSFSGSFEYLADSVGVLSPSSIVREFQLYSISLDVRDQNGQLLHTIMHVPNPAKVYNGRILFVLGTSYQTQEGHLPFTPTDIRFELLNNDILKSDINPPNANTLNEGSFSTVYVPFVALDDSDNPFHGWHIPITTLSLVAHENPIPEPMSITLTGLLGLTLLVRRRNLPAI